MRRFQMFVVAMAVVATASVGVAQTSKLKSVEDYVACMKAIGGAFGGAFKAVGSGDLAGAKPGVTTAKAYMGEVQKFFEDRKKADLVMLAKDTVDKLAAAETALNGTDAAAAAGALKAVGGACGACHTKYRDGDGKATPFSFKPGTL